MNLSEFKFTAIILGNNTANELKKTLNSIINQTLNFNENIEVIIIDNNTNYVQNIFNNDYAENIKCFESDSPIAANIGLENANGNYLIFIIKHTKNLQPLLYHKLVLLSCIIVNKMCQ